MNEETSTFPILDPNDAVTVDGADLVAEIRSATNDVLTIDGAQLAQELLAECSAKNAEPPVDQAAASSEESGSIIRPPAPSELARWRPPSAPVEALARANTRVAPDNRAQMVAILVAFVLSASGAIWFWHGSQSTGPGPVQTTVGER